MASVWHENGRTSHLRDDDLRRAALGMLHARRAMRGTLPAELIYDTALEVLLTVYVAHGDLVAIDDLIAEADVPASLLRRWLAALQSEQLIALVDGAVTLTPAGNEQMGTMLTAVVQSQRELLGWAQH